MRPAVALTAAVVAGVLGSSAGGQDAAATSQGTRAQVTAIRTSYQRWIRAQADDDAPGICRRESTARRTADGEGSAVGRPGSVERCADVQGRSSVPEGTDPATRRSIERSIRRQLRQVDRAVRDPDRLLVTVHGTRGTIRIRDARRLDAGVPTSRMVLERGRWLVDSGDILLGG